VPMKLTYKALLEQFPDDADCSFCGEKNDWDQDGFFYLCPEEWMELADSEPACKSCREGAPGKAHEELHGKGNEGR